MFTGIVQAVGSVVAWDGQRLVVNPASLEVEDIQIGESISVNGCCLTVVPGSNLGVSFDLSAETVAKTAFAGLKEGTQVNLERAMRPTDRFGGHIVQGHVDGIGEVIGIRPEGNSHVFTFRVEIGTYLIDKGSVTIDGISLTVVSPREGEFDVWVIPHTYANTNLRQATLGSKVNIEFDVIAKYVEKLRFPYQVVNY